jgi:CPA2 family monovalent cation:H+ antiporter-2
MVDAAAEVGVVLLLFTIGIEFSYDRLTRIRRLILGGGLLQVLLATGVTAGALLLFGVDAAPAVFTGLLVALSSTAIVLKLLSDRMEATSEHGQVALGLLIFQDLAIIPMVLLTPTLAGQGGSAGEVAVALLRAGVIIAAVLVIARRVMPPVLETVARACAPEVFLLSVVAVCFGTAYLTSLAGVSLSLGAFLAGLVVSESRFREHALGEILPLQILFSATFFVSVGMLLDVGFLWRNPLLVAGAVAGVLAVKAITAGVAVRALRYATPVAAASGLLLAQIGEFSFVLERTGMASGLSFAGLGADGSQLFIATTVALMALSPLLASLSGRLSGRLAAHAEAVAQRRMVEDADASHLPPLDDHVVVTGYGQAARRLVRVLRASGLPFVITTLNPDGANEAEEEGFPVLRGDSTRQRTLELVGSERAKLLVIPDDDPITAGRIAAVARSLNPTLRILVRTRYIAEEEPLTRAGSDRVVVEELEGVVALFVEVLEEYRVPPEEIAAHEEAVRRGGYAALRESAAAAQLPACTLEESGRCTRTVAVRTGAPLASRRVAEVRLEPGLTLHAVRRGGEWLSPPPDELVLEPGMELALSGNAEAFARGADVFRAAGGEPTEEVAMNGRTRVDTEQRISFAPRPVAGCTHVGAIEPVYPSARGCEDCLAMGSDWVHLRICMSCGHVGCCDSSPNKHASAHFRATAHPVMRSVEPGENWGWCFPDEVMLEGR